MPKTLTDNLIRDALDALDDERVELADTLAPGLRLRLGRRSAQWSVLAYVTAGRRSRVPLGAWPRLSIEEARAAAWRIQRHAGAGAPDGAQAGGRRPGRPLEEIVALYERDRAPQLKRAKDTVRSLRQLLAPVLAQDAHTITRLDISELVRAKRQDAPAQANRSLAYAKAMFNWAVSEGYLESSPAAAVAKPTREKPRERTPSLGELVDIWNGAEQLFYPFGPIVQLLILTAARINEVGGMRMDELDLPPGSAEGVWTVPASRSKNGRAIRIPLSPAARTVIEDAIEYRDNLVRVGWRGAVDGPYLFSRSGAAGVSGWSRAKKRLDEATQWGRGDAAPLAPWRFHDLRRSFATLACDVLHTPPEIADRCLNHVGAGTTSTVARVYARNELFDQRRDALLAWADLVTGAIRSQAQPSPRAGPAPCAASPQGAQAAHSDPAGAPTCIQSPPLAQQPEDPPLAASSLTPPPRARPVDRDDYQGLHGLLRGISMQAFGPQAEPMSEAELRIYIMTGAGGRR